MKYHPLVSVGVITYNSAKTVLETLESVFCQTYDKVELIISDDGSRDNTVEVCRDWLNSHQNRFCRSLIIESEMNTGIAANGNRFMAAAQGEWLKGIAGDDILLPSFVEDCISFVLENRQTELLFTGITEFTTNECGEKVLGQSAPTKEEADAFNQLDVHAQYLSALRNTAPLPAPGSFGLRRLMLEFPNNEKYPMSEDVPKWVAITRAGHHIEIIPKPLVLYRRGGTITTQTSSLFSFALWESKRKHFWAELGDYLLEEQLYEEYRISRLRLLKLDFMECFTDGRRSVKNRLISKIVNVLFFKVFKFRYFKAK